MRNIAALSITVLLCAGIALFIAAFCCGMTAVAWHAHDYAVAGWWLFGLSATSLTSSATLGVWMSVQ